MLWRRVLFAEMLASHYNSEWTSRAHQFELICGGWRMLRVCCRHLTLDYPNNVVIYMKTRAVSRVLRISRGRRIFEFSSWNVLGCAMCVFCIYFRLRFRNCWCNINRWAHHWREHRIEINWLRWWLVGIGGGGSDSGFGSFFQLCCSALLWHDKWRQLKDGSAHLILQFIRNVFSCFAFN